MNNSSSTNRDLLADLKIKPELKIPVLFSSIVGSIIAIIVDLRTQGSASSVGAIKQILYEQLALSGPLQFLITVILLMGIAGSLSQIFEIKSKKAALYLGASILTLIFTVIPYNDPPPPKTTPNSERVTLVLSSEESEFPSDVLLKIYNINSRKIVAQSKMIPDRLHISTVAPEFLRKLQRIYSDDIPNVLRVLQIYLDKGIYEIRIEASGFLIANTIVEIDDIPSSLTVVDLPLAKTIMPLFIQRAFK